jgi:hypothetical protein
VRWLLRGVAAIGHDVRAPAIATRITLRDHIAPVRQHADGSLGVHRFVPGSLCSRRQKSGILGGLTLIKLVRNRTALLIFPAGPSAHRRR